MELFKKYKRKIIQFATAILYNCNFLGFKNGSIYKGSIKSICVPGLNCYSCPGAIASCPIGAFQSFLMQKKYGKAFIARVPIYVIGLLILFGVIFGRIICGFLCPFGLIQELIYKIPIKKIKKNEITRKFTMVKYIILVILVVVFPIALHFPGFCKYICPAGTLEAGIFHVITNENLRKAVGLLFSWKVLVLIIIVVMSILMYRFFCRFLCPLGAFYSLFNKVAIFGIKVDMGKCTNCNRCINTCKMDVKKVGDRECIECGECKNVCQTNAIYYFRRDYVSKGTEKQN